MPQPSSNSISAEKFLNIVLEEAVRDRASDVHIEPLAGMLRVRFRIDGYLQERYQRPLEEYDALVMRVKAISDLDIASRLPQDGHFEFSVELTDEQKEAGPVDADEITTFSNQTPSRLTNALSSLFGGDAQSDANSSQPRPENAKKNTSGLEMPAKNKERIRPAGMYILNVRVSLFPTVYGEAVVFRLLNRGDMLIPLSALGMMKEDLAAVRQLISRSYGMILTTGPSGSGKTTTLYAILQELKDKKKNIVTLEDPVEFYFGDIRQTQIRSEQGLTY
ncbi:MAG: ATPase, T2SS/T4P/T4SS family, partial [Patescibacteria group bacterium]